MPTLRLGSTAPDFEAETSRALSSSMSGSVTPGYWLGYLILQVDAHQNLLSCQAILFSHPDDFTPVCTTELAEVSRREADFKKRNVKVIGLSTNSVESHHKWIQDINEWGKTDVQYPIVCFLGYTLLVDLPSHTPQIADSDRKIATLYDMLDYQDASNVDKKGLPLTVLFFQYLCIYLRVEKWPVGPNGVRDRSQEGYPPHNFLSCCVWSQL